MKSLALIELPAKQEGVALGIVVWFIAGMALLVSGIVAEARMDTRLAQIHYTKARVAALGDGAIHLALAEQYSRKQSGQRGSPRSQGVNVSGNNVDIRMIPAGLLVNISTENARGFSALFARARAANQSEALPWRASPEQLARAVIAYRDGANGRRGQSFYDLEDLMRVPGVDRGVYDAVRDYIVTEELAGEISGSARDTTSRLRQLESALDGDGAMLNGQLQHGASMLRIDAVIELGGTSWLRRRWVSLEGGQASGLPWRILRTEAARTMAGGQVN